MYCLYLTSRTEDVSLFYGRFGGRRVKKAYPRVRLRLARDFGEVMVGDYQSQLELEDIKERYGLQVISHRIGELTIKVAQIDRVDEMIYAVYPDAVTTHGDAPVWMITWPGSFALAEYLIHRESIGGLKALELGCGTAATGIALYMGGAQVVCTDYDPLALTLARYNARINGCISLSVRFLDWYRPDLHESFDLVVGSEVVYFEKSFRPLLSVLKKYTKPNGKIILSDQQRPQMNSFVELCCGEGFGYQQLNQMVYLPDRNQPVRITVLSKNKK